MTVTQDQWDRAMSYQAYKEQMTRNRDRFEENEKGLALSADDTAAFRSLPTHLKVLALAEDWCADVVANLPILGRVAREAGTLDVRVLLRDQNLDVTDQYLKDGQFRSIPVFVFMDQDLRELGVFIERPESVTQLREEKRQELYRQHPEWGSPDAPIAQLPEEQRTAVQAAIADMRAQTAGFANAEVVRALRSIVEQAAARA